ncbi:type I-F CRISPR-associated endoribonuclease Cas6/Csy4 [Vibrio coralliirubri]|uniref:type I-F CRISPR-associated endoribonuclease Cas6/Csy4 n=1 Tax=Vibrio coralliirubri TaxID=1516159 RepID=UPI0022846D9D|nr:type I-F CRISPR-associated endoribonuclease Cas6/Csy4 [Vibrio coralliirubri]MCY9861511.1 type I-F CRISPR-associated endoribonuclease Cas6/Csy4 [Vibrio coralliirubri]
MKHYIDLVIKAPKAMHTNAVMGLTYSAVHSYLSSNKIDNIGVSFPCRQLDLGGTLRLHSDELTLAKMISTDWLQSISAYVSLGQVAEIPNVLSYQVVSRQQSKMSPSRLRRLEKRGNRSADDLNQYRRKMAANILSNPYLDLNSASTGQMYRKFFRFDDVSHEINGKFNEFGLSRGATVPVF